jgi:hypothetical protein
MRGAPSEWQRRSTWRSEPRGSLMLACEPRASCLPGDGSADRPRDAEGGGPEPTQVGRQLGWCIQQWGFSKRAFTVTAAPNSTA